MRQRDDNDDDSGFGFGTIMLALLGGAAAGAAFALLNAPRTGIETREQLRGYMEDGKGKANRALADGKTRANRVPTALKEGVAAAQQAFRAKVEQESR